MRITEQTAVQLAEKIKTKELTARAVTEAYLARIAEKESLVGAFLSILETQALAQADAVDAKIAAGEPVGALAGVPVAIKDNLCTKGIETTCASAILRGFVPPYDATVIQKLRAADAILIGKTNLDEFAMGSSTENSAVQKTKNPWDLSRVPGGSSGGSAASVAADFAPLALGSDTGGSIRQPASFCGLVGVKPTYGRVSRYGLVAFASSLDQIGPFAHTIEDAALLLNCLSGADYLDSTSVPRDVPDYTKALNKPIDQLKIGIPTEYFADGIDPSVRAALMTAIGVLRGLGASVAECSLPHTEYTLPVYYLIAPAEASSNLARYDGVRYGPRAEKASSHIDLFEKTREDGFGPEVKRRILIGTYALSAGYYDAFYLKAQQVRTLIQQDFNQAFEQFDALITPTAPTTAFSIGEKSGDPLAMKLADIFTLSANLAGIPAISQCCGFDNNHLPIGMQLLGPAFSEETLFQIAHAYETATDWHTRRPSF
jgi:aspartyl-tRNA(Asn)/glutamyl-tRNA(Gln) amidotransferase subunit A